MELFIFILLYIFVVFIGVRLFVPYFGFTKSPLPSRIPDDFDQTIHKINQQSKTNHEYLQNAYNFITSKYYGNRLNTILYFWRVFDSPFKRTSGYLHCELQNYLLRTMLVKSGRFTDNDIRTKVVPFNFIIHQYLDINVDGKWIHIDPWAKSIGIPFGKHAFLFG